MIIKAKNERVDIKTVCIKHVFIYVLGILRNTRAVNSTVSGSYMTWPTFELFQFYIYLFPVQVSKGSDK